MSQHAETQGTQAIGPGGSPELPKQYKPSENEARIRSRWESSGAFHADPQRVLRGEAEPYCVLIPPPNVTDRLHLGHALNNTLQDVLVRAHRMMGFETLWMPGTDHAGIATQAVVERRLRKEGILKGPLKESMKREDFVARVQAFKDEYEATITGQLRAMGCSCDWDRQRFTMDPVCARAVYEAFFRLFKDGLIYRGKRLVNWDPVLQTAVADDETEDVEIDGHMHYLRYPLVHQHGAVTQRELARGKAAPEDAVPVTWSELRSRGWPVADDAEYEDDKQAWITVATTRPETYLGDAAVAVNPKDGRAKALRGLSVELPLVGRIIPVIEDDYVVLPASMQADPEEAVKDPKAAIATGFLKVTPAHDRNDYEIGQRHKLPLINVMAPDGSISDKHGWTDVGDAHIFVGKKGPEARKLVLKEFEARGLLQEVKPYRHSVPHSDRSKAAIEPYLSDQWYVKVTDERMAAAANAALVPEQRSKQQTTRAANAANGDGELEFHPARYAKTYEQWHDNIRDWCISRQLWWGHRIPVWRKTLRFKTGHCADELGAGAAMGMAYSPNCWVVSTPLDRWDPTRWSPELEKAPEDGEHHVFICVQNEKAAPDETQQSLESLEKQGFVRDPDVLDTWFSSGLWPMSTMGWPDPKSAGPGFEGLLEAFNPSSTLCTAREIITLWVSRMVMFNRYFRGQDLGMGEGRGPLPYRDVFIHSVIQDGEGRKMSKSLGNGVDPLDIIDSHGADAMRYTLVKMTTQTQDVRLPVAKDPKTGKNTSAKFDEARNFCNKLWNAARFAIGILEKPSESPAPRDGEAKGELALVDRWMLSRLAAGVESVTASIKGFQFNEYALTVYSLLWNDFCDWYLEAIKPTVASDAAQRGVLKAALETIVRLLHPVAPFVTEAIWERLAAVPAPGVPGVDLGPSRKGNLLCTAAWPRIAPSLRDERAEARFERIRALVGAVREVRAQRNVPPKRAVTLHLPAAIHASISQDLPFMRSLPSVVLEAVTTDAAPATAAAFTFEGSQCHLSNLADAGDAGAERARLEKAVADLSRTIDTLTKRLSNPGYADKAPPAMVQQSREQLAKAEADLKAATAALKGLG